MENCTNSTTNCSIPDSMNPVPANAGFTVFATLTFAVVVATFSLIIITIAALCAAHSVAKLVRVFLINLLVAGLVMTVFAGSIAFSAIILSFALTHPPPLEFCRFLSYGLGVGCVARLYSLTAFSVIVLLIVKYNIKNIKAVRIFLLLLAFWLIPVLLNSHILVPPIFAIQYYDNTICFPWTVDASIINEARITFSAIWIVFGGFVPLIISIAISVTALCHVKLATISSGSSYIRGMVKFILFLVIGNVLNVVALVSISITLYFYENASIYLAYCFVSVFSVPTPVLVILFLKPVREKLRSVFCFCCLRSLYMFMANKASFM